MDLGTKGEESGIKGAGGLGAGIIMEGSWMIGGNRNDSGGKWNQCKVRGWISFFFKESGIRLSNFLWDY